MSLYNEKHIMLSADVSVCEKVEQNDICHIIEACTPPIAADVLLSKKPKINNKCH
ncbi:MAG: hypothetical protein Hyperionvirus10_31 [Hyperionvirus sp.]|uniref:Uncharacterized protein n=1 Tax=Hyperionvirus sp. TaxID=2487770 RepID=A0A3G5A8Y5_9VIRU|nr:MAG: hypothetical protein Hyperionvirus10_31 [Hyperionvirus sp.]